MPQPPPLDAVFWDMDGTLVDTEPLWNAVQRRLVEEAGGIWTTELAHRPTGQALDVSARRLQHAGVRREVQEIIEISLDGVIDRLSDELPWRPGAPSLLARLHRAGVPCALVTMSHLPLVRAVTERLPAGAFRFCVTGERVDRGKPDPEPYLTAVALMRSRVPHLSLQRSVALEDSLPGVTSAVAAGLPTIAIPHLTELPRDERWQTWTTLEDTAVADLAAAGRAADQVIA